MPEESKNIKFSIHNAAPWLCKSSALFCCFIRRDEGCGQSVQSIDAGILGYREGFVGWVRLLSLVFVGLWVL